VTKSLDIFSSKIVMNIMDQISEINTNLSSSNVQDLETNLTVKYVITYYILHITLLIIDISNILII